MDAVDFKVNIFREAVACLCYLSCPVLFAGWNQLVGWQSGDEGKGQKVDSYDASHNSLTSINRTNVFFFFSIKVGIESV